MTSRTAATTPRYSWPTRRACRSRPTCVISICISGTASSSRTCASSARPTATCLSAARLSSTRRCSYRSTPISTASTRGECATSMWARTWPSSRRPLTRSACASTRWGASRPICSNARCSRCFSPGRRRPTGNHPVPPPRRRRTRRKRTPRRRCARSTSTRCSPRCRSASWTRLSTARPSDCAAARPRSSSAPCSSTTRRHASAAIRSS